MADDGALAAIFKAYDVRGVVPRELDAKKAFAIGAAFARFMQDGRGRHRGARPAHDMPTLGRSSCPPAPFAVGVRSRGATVTITVGLASTGHALLRLRQTSPRPGRCSPPLTIRPSTMGSSSAWQAAQPVAVDSGLADIQRFAGGGPPAGVGDEHQGDGGSSPKGVDWVGEFAEHVRYPIVYRRRLVEAVGGDRRHRQRDGWADRAGASSDRCPAQLELLYGELRRKLPEPPPGQPDRPREPGRAAPARIVKDGSDIGLAFDGDADRVFLVDELGEPLSGSTTTAIVAKAILSRHPGETVLYNLICSKTVAEVIAECGGKSVRTRVGHSFIKAEMARTGAVFGGEHSGHYYFRDNYRADSGIIAALVVLEALSAAGVPLSELRRPFDRYADSGEINTEVADPVTVVEALAVVYGEQGAVRSTGSTGLTVELRHVVVQPPTLEHRAAVAPERRGGRRRVAERARRRGPRTPARRRLAERRMMSLDPFLLELLVDPEDKEPLWYFADEDTLYNPRLKPPLARWRDGIPWCC